MRDYDAIKEALTFYAATAETTRKSRALLDAADAIEELVAERDKALNRLCEFCGVCSEKSRSPMECEIAGFVEPPKKEDAK